MARNQVNVSVADEIKNVSKAIQRVTSAIFAGAPGVAGTIGGKRKSAQFSFKIRGADEKRSIQSQMHRQILQKVFQQDAPRLEAAIKQAIEAVVYGLVGVGPANVRVFNRTLGVARSPIDIEQAPFARFIKSPIGAGEVGLPDPEESLRKLKVALVASLTVDVIVRSNGPQVKFSFDQRKLLKLTPHPNQFERGAPSPFFSWLSLVTGPDFVTGGTPGYGLVRVGDLLRSLRESTQRNSKQASHRNMRRASIVDGLIRVSRTRGNAGEFAAIMMSTRRRRGGRSPAEAFGGSGNNYRPSPRYVGFWDEWWVQIKVELGTWSRRVMRAAVRELLGG